ncbi:Predicted P-loop ATPase and inactivated derivatives [Lutimaribacter pacificus]|uniref:Predicted P-loop ATPase and inactivated derivatives n=1 Tax=Lutimaribacter pacificus TaxID=391948 RepID=A0A1H0F7S4_9RHOB|nr:virulence-associated E family protein [Lutimaribacter pacificus]SDN90589.1 Predicted P-loop ATPase and inactivated derivatives [Lutimaribacter pacificus]SHK45852.1 Predicted P-loop ATPase and inactivated derivatives [Lutimaribacter pacificus]
MVPKPQLAAACLRLTHPDGPWKLTAIASGRTKQIFSKTFSKVEEALGWASRQNEGGANLYWQIARHGRAADAKTKLARTDVVDCAFHWTDIDCGPGSVEDVCALLNNPTYLSRKGLPPVSFLLLSGNGVWAFWKRTTPLTDWQEVASINIAIRDALTDLPKDDGWKGADSAQNADRIARLPGFVNWPDEKKRAKGATEVLATWTFLRAEPIPDNEFASFAEADGPTSAEAATGTSGSPLGVVPVADHPLLDVSGEPWRSCGDVFEDLDGYALPLRSLQLLAGGVAELDDALRKRKDTEGDSSGSGYAWEVYCALARARVPGRIALPLLLDPDRPIGRWHRDRKVDARKLLKHDLPRAIERVGAEAFWPEGDKPEQGPERSPRLAGFVTDKNGQPVAKHQRNIRLALDWLGVRVSYDQFTDRRLIDGLEGFGPWLDDAALTALYLGVDARFGMLPPVDFFQMVVNDYAQRNAFHPVRDYLARVEPEWDGTPRIERWLIDYGGAEDTPFTREVSKLTLIAAARRARRPGSKFDEMLVLEGPQGVGKSSAIEALMPDPNWFSDNFSFTLRDREAIEQLAGRWVIEAPELKGMRKSESETRKAFMSRQTDRGRLAYARTVSEVPRTCVFIGTTNDEKYLTDPTGNRRFWPVRVEGFDIAAIRADRDQLWAEAATLESQGHSIRLRQDLWRTAATVQHSRRVDDPWAEVLSAALGDLTGKIDPALIWDIVGVEVGRRSQADNERLGALMRDLGWERAKRRLAAYETTRWAYVRGDENERQTEIRLELRDGRWVATKELPF